MGRIGKLSGRQKASIFMISLGPEKSAQIMKYLSEEEIEQLTLEIASIRTIESDELENVSKEFSELYMASHYIAQGGIDYAKEVLEKALGNEKAIEIIGHLSSNLQIKPFDFIRKTDPSQVLNFIHVLIL